MAYALTLLQYLCIACKLFFIFLTGIYQNNCMTIFYLPGFSALRVYALLNGRYLVACLVFLLNLVPFAINMVSIITAEKK